MTPWRRVKRSQDAGSVLSNGTGCLGIAEVPPPASACLTSWIPVGSPISCRRLRALPSVIAERSRCPARSLPRLAVTRILE